MKIELLNTWRVT